MTEDYIKQLHADVQIHGEVHAIVEEHDAEVELRRGQTAFKFNKGVVNVTGPDTTHVFDVDRFVRHYKPHDVFHE